MMSRLQLLYQKLIHPFILIIWSIVSIIIIPLSNIGIIPAISFGFVIFGWIAIILYYVLLCTIHPKNYIKNKNSGETELKIRLLNILYFFLFTLLLVITRFSKEQSRLFELIFVLLVALIIIQIIISPKTIEKIALIAFQIILLVVSLYISIYSNGYWNMGSDLFYHSWFNEQIVQNGFLLIENKELYSPIEHIEMAIIQQVTSCTVPIDTIIGITLPLLLLSTVIYSIVKHYMSWRIGLFALLLFNTTTYVVGAAVNNQTTTYAFNLFLITLLIICNIDNKVAKSITNDLSKKRYGTIILLITLFLSIILCHVFSSFVILLALFGLYIGGILTSGKWNNPMLFNIIYYSVLLALIWIYYSFKAGLLMVTTILYDTLILYEGLVSKGVSGTVTNYIYMDGPGMMSTLLNYITLAIIIGTVIILFLFVGNKNRFNSDIWSMWLFLFPYGLLLALAIGVEIVAFSMTGRIFMYLSVFMIIGMSCILHLIYNPSQTSLEKNRYAEDSTPKTITNVIVIALIMALIFISITSPVINSENPLNEKYTTYSGKISYNEFKITKFIDAITPDESIVYSDYVEYELLVRYYGQASQIPDWTSLGEYKYDYILVRKKILERPTVTLVNKKLTGMIQLNNKYITDTLYHNNKIYSDNLNINLYR